MSRKGEYFRVKIKGDSMLPDIHDGDYVIVRRQPDAESGQIVAARVNGNEGCCKKLVKYSGMISLVSLNAKYDPMNFTDEEIRTKPIEIVGIVVELRRKFSM
jgi:repressor LexA